MGVNWDGEERKEEDGEKCEIQWRHVGKPPGRILSFYRNNVLDITFSIKIIFD